MYDIEKALHTPPQCQIVMKRALDQGDRDLYAAVFRYYCKLVGGEHDHPSDSLVHATYEAIAAYEQILHEKHGRRVTASRTLQKIKNKGVYQSLIEWSQLHGNRPGFQALIEAVLSKLTAEAIVVQFADRFPVNVVESCRETLRKAGA